MQHAVIAVMETELKGPWFYGFLVVFSHSVAFRHAALLESMLLYMKWLRTQLPWLAKFDHCTLQ